MTDSDQTPKPDAKFDFSAFPDETCFFERRSGRDRRAQARPAGGPEAAGPPPPAAQPARRQKKERRRRIDPTTFEKQYTAEEMEFMTAMQQFKVRTGRPFPTYGEVLRIAVGLGYRRAVLVEDAPEADPTPEAADLVAAGA